ncbi:hypothetical protein O181_070540 [Austropuccinia psidii MF-1]|uniref:Uncharacterized protein n=1 Tax=Austropuccinia psidii MF-1 TaxID=1389203 RepID=A0A9Q3F508_9BASI|nr:hypothetical protein [Austropuccinia psidii MF-1]
MNIAHKCVNIHKNSYGLSIWELPNTPDNPSYVPANSKSQIPFGVIIITDLGNKFLEEFRESYKKDKNFHIFNSLLDKDLKDSSLANSSDDIWKTSYDSGIFNLFDGISYHGSKNTCVVVLFSKMSINTILP